MPVVFHGRLYKNLDGRVAKMSLPVLVAYERLLWRWMDKTGGAASIARQLNMIHREVEWRAQDTEFGTGPRRVGEGSR